MQLMRCGCAALADTLAVIRKGDSMTFDVTKNRIPFGLLTPEEQATLKAWPYGWEYCSGDYPEEGWNFTGDRPSWLKGFVYRGKPAPKVTCYWFNIYDGNQIGHIWNSQAYASYHAPTDGVVMRMQICNGEVTVTKET